MSMQQGDFEVEEKDGWVYARNIPLFDEHERDGTTYDEARLTKIASNNNKRITDTGDMCPIVAGHQPDDKPEDEIPILGWASNFKVGEWGKEEPRKCVFADLKFSSENWQRAKEMPRRSVELWYPHSEEAFIDPLALLSATTPHRDLGLLYAKKYGGENRYTYQLGGPMDKDELMKCFAEMLENSDVGKYVRDQMKQAEDDVGESEMDEADEPETKPEEEDNDEEEAEEDKDKVKNERDAERRKYARLENEYKVLNSRLAELEKRERVAVRKADLLSLEQEGVMFSFVEELDNVSDMDSKSYSRHLDTMRKRYQRSPIGVRVNVEELPAHGRVMSKGADGSGQTELQGRKISELLLYGKAKTKEDAIKMVMGGVS